MALAVPSFDIVLEPESLHRSNLGSITGRITITSGDFVFPSQGWSDFPVTLIGWWIDAGRALETGANARFLFMDGPFEAIAKPLTEDRCELLFRNSPRQIFASEASIPDVLTAIRRAAKQIVDECRKRRWDNDEVERVWYAIR